MQKFFLELQYQKRDALQSITREKLNELIDKAANDQEHCVASKEISAIKFLLENNSLPLYNCLDRRDYVSAVILKGDNNRATLVFFNPPTASLHLEAAPSEETAKQLMVGEISITELLELVAKTLNDTNVEISDAEEQIRQEGPKRRETQRAEAKKLRERLAEFNVLSLMHNVELTRATMGLIANLEHELKAELEKSLKKN